tara:strand:+ start:903 stop:1589 length:687 start_codon:yes stop_codon:yes gene_type:complete
VLDKIKNMRKIILLLLLFPFFTLSQNTTLIGDVDCDGEVTSEDASLILQFVTSVIEELPCEENMTGLTPDQLEEIINLISDNSSNNFEETITMISPMYHSDTFPDFLTWDNEEGASIYYADAFRFCAQLVHEDYNDWRLPTVDAMHIYVQQNLEDEFIISNNDTPGFGTFWCSAMYNNPSASMGTNNNLVYSVPIVNISGSNHPTFPNQILFYGAMSTYSMLNCFCVR